MSLSDVINFWISYQLLYLMKFINEVKWLENNRLFIRFSCE